MRSERRQVTRRRPRAWALAALVGAAMLLPACASSGTVSVSAGVAVPAPWGGVTVGAAVPLGPGRVGPFTPMW